MTTATHPPACLSCDLNGPRWYYSRGLCNRCYHRAKNQGTATDYPACGRRTVPYLGKNRPAHPTAPRHVVPARALGWPERPAVGVADNLARWDRPCWTTARWNRRPRDPGFAAYHDADTAQQAA